jgi:catechol 2,3-dioxygenase
MERHPMREEPIFRPRRLGHANLFVGDLDRSMAFYTTVVGLEEVYRRPAVKAGFLSNGNTHHDIGMVEVTSPLCRTKTPGLYHLAFELESEMDLVEGYRRAGARQKNFARTVDHDITYSIYDSDPDGHALEYYADSTKEWRTKRSGIVTKPTPQWTPGERPPSAERHYHLVPEIRRVENAVFHPRRITHAVLVAENYAAEIDYYVRIAGLTLVHGGADSPFAAFRGTCEGRDLAIFRALDGLTPSLHHIAFEAADEADLHRSARRLAESGFAIEATVDQDTRQGVVIRDPDGIRILFYVDRTKDRPSLGDVDPRHAPYLI